MTLFKSEKVLASLRQHEVTQMLNLYRNSETYNQHDSINLQTMQQKTQLKTLLDVFFFPNEHVPTFFFFLHVNLWGSIAASSPKPSKVNIFPVSSNSLFILPLQGPNVVMVSQRRAVRLTHVDISSASAAKALNVAPGCTKEKTSL